MTEERRGDPFEPRAPKRATADKWAIKMLIAALVGVVTSQVGGGEGNRPLPATDPTKWITHLDYPKAALDAGEEGKVDIALTVDEFGRISECIIDASSGSSALDQGTCAVFLKSAEFKPGKAGTYRQKVTWQMPAGDHEKKGWFEPSTPVEVTTTSFPTSVFEIETVVDEQGVIASCRVVEFTGPSTHDPCSTVQLGSKSGAGYVRNGKPVKAVIRRRMTIETRFPD